MVYKWLRGSASRDVHINTTWDTLDYRKLEYTRRCATNFCVSLCGQTNLIHNISCICGRKCDLNNSSPSSNNYTQFVRRNHKKKTNRASYRYCED